MPFNVFMPNVSAGKNSVNGVNVNSGKIIINQA